MTQLEYEQSAARIESRLMAVVGKVCLIVIGLMFGIIAALDPKLTHRWVYVASAGIPLALGVYWIIIDKRTPTPDEELDDLLIEASKKISRAGSIQRLLEDYRANGADDITLSRIRGAGRLLRQRGRSKVFSGIAFSGAGLVLGLGGMLLMMWKVGPVDKHLLKYGFLGAGLGMGYIVQGLRFQWYARRFWPAEKPPVVQRGAGTT